MPGLVVNLLLVALMASAQPAAPLGTGRVVGRVVDAGTGNPVAGVDVWLNGPISPTAPWPPTLPPLPPQGQQTAPLPPPDPSRLLALGRLRSETNADGVFEIRDVPNGRWAIQARQEGYVAAPIASMPLIEMAGGRNVTVPDIRLDRGGAISGRVLDAKGNAMSGVMVLATQLRRLPNGTIQIGGSGSGAQTNDLGEYRLSGLAPGEHYVAAQPPPRPMGIGVFAGTPQVPASSTYVATFFPGTPDAAVASAVTVVRGGTTSAIDFSMQSVRAHQVSGIVVDAGGRPVNGAIVRLASRQAPLGGSIQGGPSQADGGFRITNVPPGTYAVMAAVPIVTRNGSGGMSGSLSFGAAARPGAAPEVLVQGDVTGLRVVVSQP